MKMLRNTWGCRCSSLVKKLNADNDTRTIILILVSCLMSLEVQIGKNLPSSQKLQIWTSKDIKPLTEIMIAFLVLLQFDYYLKWYIIYRSVQNKKKGRI